MMTKMGIHFIEKYAHTGPVIDFITAHYQISVT